jgi:primary-amine oxidase
MIKAMLSSGMRASAAGRLASQSLCATKLSQRSFVVLSLTARNQQVVAPIGAITQIKERSFSLHNSDPFGFCRQFSTASDDYPLDATASTSHPLDALTYDEISAVAATIRSHVGVSIEDDPTLEKLRFVAISLKEPTKADLVAVLDGKTPSKPIARQAEVVTLNPVNGLGSEYVLDLSPTGTAEIVNSKLLAPGLQPMFTPEDCELAEEIAKNSPEVQAALKERYGITDMSKICGDPWSVNLGCEEDVAMTKWRGEGGVPGRLVQTFLYYRAQGEGMECNHYSHPIDILPVVDLNARKVVTINGMDRPAPKIPELSINYHRDLVKTNSYLQSTWRDETLKALNVEQPDGPSFAVTGRKVEWQKWSFYVGWNYREGLVLHDLRFEGRPVVHRASLVEMAVPYGDPHPPFQRKCAFDVGDYGLGYCANSLELGCDCLGHIHYFDAVMSDAAGNPTTKKSAVCMHEEDQGILWKHVEYRNGHNESRRSRELVISSIATVVNYEYLFYWRLKQDGTIDYEIKLTGELSTNIPSEPEEGVPTHGLIVAPGVNSQTHQHMFCARLDMAVDGMENTVTEIDVVVQPPDPITNPFGNAFGPVVTTLESEKKAIRTADPSRARAWKVSNATKTNAINGKPTAYKILPFTRGPAMPVMLVQPDAMVAKKGAFAMANLWVTPYAEDERYPAGEYTPQGDGSVGVADWTAADRNLVGKDIVLWHAFGVTHVPRIEDFPVMPCESTGFSLKPDNFFLGNPAIDLPPDENKASKLAESSDCCAAK